jgi:hypothetical protein
MVQKLRNMLLRVKALRHDKPGVFWLRTVVLAAVILLIVLQRNFWTPDTLFLVLLGVFFVFGQAKMFITRFGPFVLLLLAYDSFRGIADDLNHNVHFYEMINIDRAWFGGALPTQVLQDWWWHGQVQWYDFYFYLLYTFHFLAPLLLAVLIWKLREKLYWPFVGALVGLSFAAFITYIIFPAAPPWMASDLGYIAPIHRISSDIWYAMGVTNFSEVYANLSPNAVAAVPSLHAAYPLLFVLFLNTMFGWRRLWWAMFYPVSVWVGIVYLGEHYVVDAVLGIIYALTIYALTMRYVAWRASHPSQFWQQYRQGYKWGHGRVKIR